MNYIVKNTVGPVVEEKWREAEGKKLNLIDATLSVKVLDPAMGSGHFLVGSVEFLADSLIDAAQKDIDAGRLSDEPRFYDKGWARREVVSHCIYGVDLNPMAVEFAKVGLWLKTISKEKPLSFLDHRLKQGNSLIGAQLIDLPWYPDLKDKTKKRENTILQKFEDEVHRPFVDKIVHQLKQLSEIDDDTIEHVRQKKELFEKLKENKQYLQIKSIADVYTAVYFGNETTEVNKNPKFAYNDLFWALKGDDKEWSRKTYKHWFKKAMEIAEDKSFFHWELEFPELFFEGGAPKENPGWDAVVGNPPWGAAFDKQDKSYLTEVFESYFGDIDSCNLFTEIGIKLVSNKGNVGFITPNTWLYTAQNTNARKYVLKNSHPHEIVELEKNIFEDVPDIVPVIFSLIKERTDERCRIKLLKFKYHPEELFLDNNFRAIYDVNIKFWRENDDFVINTRLSPETISLIEKIKSNSVIASDVCDVLYGIKTGDNTKFLSRSGDSGYVPALVQAFEVRRYSIECDGNYLHYIPDLEGYRHHKVDVPKIIVQYTRKISMPIRIMAAFDYEGIYYPLNTFSYITKKQESAYSLLYLMAVFSSSTLNFYHANTFIDYGIKPTYLQKHPIRRISFTTPPDRRAALAEQAKALYSEFVGAQDRGDPAFKCEDSLLDFVDERLSAAPEESDVVHDLLAHLAERMIEMNKEKNTEIKGFLRWLEGEIGAPVEELTNKTALKEYYDYKYDFETFVKVLAKNKKKLKEGYDPTRRVPKDKLEKEYNASLNKLTPLLKRIEATDGLIDLIVYKLYGLTEDEIRIVEESISGNKDLNTKEDTKL